MATVTGVVQCINVADDQGFVQVRENVTLESETFILWNSPTDPSAFTRVMHSMWISMLRDSIESGRSVTITTLSGGALVNGITLRR